MKLNVGDKVTDCPRIGLSEQADLENRQQLIEGDYNKKIIEQQQKQIDLKDLMITDQKARGDLWQDEAQRERDYADKMKANGDQKFWLGLGVGLLTVLVTGYALGQVNK